MYKMYSFILIFILGPFFVYGQNQECGTVPTYAQIDYLTQTRSARQNWNNPETILYVPIQHHVVQESNCTGGLTSGDISFVMNALNTYYTNSDIQFFQCDTINYINLNS